MDSLAVHDLGLVHPKKVFNFYNKLHAYLASCGVDGVKVDMQNIIETLGTGHSGKVSLTRAYHQALKAFITQNFQDNGCIAWMCHNTDGIYSAKQTTVVRASDDFYHHDPASHTIHISSVAYNSVFLVEFMQPDWDMYHSFHPAADYHAAARAVGGCLIYASLLKIWNVNKYTGVVGVFNCQGASWCKVTKKTRIHDESPDTLTGSVQATDVDSLSQVTKPDWNGETVVYAYRSGNFAL
ncbi:putative galactinol--sucrose galactosyltransferase 2 [Camellia lanceoleosa]|uniref:Galactinol--sucrose galactosyltransferase 2 n=1 Tax=Camellia lanceoleosa TaxID=1840588 RepID=A0ACC0GDN0_9ERIC|nr:putative galactinol--sucrose galactosyltransferase 2 [Camellia lanceoleosa]